MRARIRRSSIGRSRPLELLIVVSAPFTHRPIPLKSWEEVSNYRAIADADRQLENLRRRAESLWQIRERIDATWRLAPAARQLHDQRESVVEELERTEEDKGDLESHRARLVRKVAFGRFP